MTTIEIVSFGYGHADTASSDGVTPLGIPVADITLDLRRVLRNPHTDPAMRYLTGLDQAVYEHVMNTPGAQMLADSTVFAAHTLATEAKPDRLVVATGCAGGRHRAVVMARHIHQLLTPCGTTSLYTVRLVHRDVDRPVLPSTAHN